MKKELVMASSDEPVGIVATLKERRQTHGRYDEVSGTIQSLKQVCKEAQNWDTLIAPQKEAVEMICHKLGRILNGDPDWVDSWHDISGYATLVEKLLKGEQL